MIDRSDLNLFTRADEKYAIGAHKPKEDSFATIPDLLNFHATKTKIQLKAATADGVSGETYLVLP